MAPLDPAGSLSAANVAPSPVYLTGEEFLRVSTLANAAGITLTITGRILRSDNTIVRQSYTHAPNSNRTLTSTIVALPEGWLLALTIRASGGTPAFGQVWAMLELGISNGATFTVDQTLGCGFLTTNTPFAWPLNVNTLPLDGPGNLRSITGATPAAGAEIAETVPTGARWQPIAFRALFTPSATVASRQPTLIVDDGTNAIAQVMGAGTLPANTPCIEQWFAAVPMNSGLAAGAGVNPLPPDLRLGAGYRFRSVTTAIQATDQWSAVQYLVREWMTGE